MDGDIHLYGLEYQLSPNACIYSTLVMSRMGSMGSALVICSTNISYYFAGLDNARPKRQMDTAQEHPNRGF
jgi:hypothetical protein